MKNIIKNSAQQIVADRKILFLSIFILLGGMVYIAYVLLSLQASDLQLATRYTSFGGTHFYRSKWFYLFSFVGFGLLFIVTHIGMMVKLYMTEMKPLANAMGWLGVIMLVIMFTYTYHVLSIAYLS